MSPTLTLSRSTLTPPTPLTIEPLLTPFLTLLTRTQRNHTYLQHQSHLEELKRAKQTTVQVEEDISDGEGDEYAREHDIEPKDWKEQDHYRVMGLSHLRWRASATAIKKACKLVANEPGREGTERSVYHEISIYAGGQYVEWWRSLRTKRVSEQMATIHRSRYNI